MGGKRSREGTGGGIIESFPGLESTNRHWVIITIMSAVSLLSFKGAAQGGVKRAEDGVGKMGMKIKMLLGISVGEGGGGGSGGGVHVEARGV